MRALGRRGSWHDRNGCHGGHSPGAAAAKAGGNPALRPPLGNLAVEEPQRNWWTELQLGSPEALIKIFVQQSGCFSLVDRGAGLAAAQRERALSSGGALQQGSNLGGGQIVAADYVLVPDVISQNASASGNNFGAALGGLLGNRTLGALAGSLSFNSSTADVTLAITNVRTTQIMATIDGHSKKTDIGFGAGGGSSAMAVSARPEPRATTTPKSAR